MLTYIKYILLSGAIILCITGTRYIISNEKEKINLKFDKLVLDVEKQSLNQSFEKQKIITKSYTNKVQEQKIIKNKINSFDVVKLSSIETLSTTELNNIRLCELNNINNLEIVCQK